MTKLKNKIRETVSSILSITCIVFLLNITITPIPVDTMLLFTCGVVILIIGMGLFSLGADMSVMLMGEDIGTMFNTPKKRCLMICIIFAIGFIITITEPDLTVLVHQVPGIPDSTLIRTAAVGVSFLLIMALLRILFHQNLKYLLMLFYVLVFMLACFSMDTFMTVASDSNRVTTGPVVVPFFMTLGIDMASAAQKHAEEESFDAMVLRSIGSILAVLLLGILYEPQGVAYALFEMAYVGTSKGVIRISLTELPHYMREVSKALLPILRFFLLFQLISSYFNKRAIIKILVGALYTFLGLILFLCGVNIGFMPADYFIGTQAAALSYNWILIPIGVLIGLLIAKVESAVHVFIRQVEDISSGATPTKAVLCSLSIDVDIPLGIATLCILSYISIMVFLIPGYLTAIILSFFVSNISTGIVSNSDSVVSSPMIAIFLLPSAMGVCGQLGGSVLLGVFDIVAMVATALFLTIQTLGLVMIEHKETAAGEPQEDSIMEFEEVTSERTEN